MIFILFFVKTRCFYFQGSCSFLAMVATLPLTQLFFFHVLLVKKVCASEVLLVFSLTIV